MKKIILTTIFTFFFSFVFSQDYRIEEFQGKTYIYQGTKTLYTINFSEGLAYGTVTDENNNTLFRVTSSENGYEFVDNANINNVWTFTNEGGRSFMRNSNSLDLFETILTPSGSMLMSPDREVLSTSTNMPDGSISVSVNDNTSSVDNAVNLMKETTEQNLEYFNQRSNVQEEINISPIPSTYDPPTSSGVNYDLIAGARELANAQTSLSNAAADGFTKGFNDAYNNALALQAWSRSLYANAKFKGTPSYNPKTKRAFKKLKVEKFKSLESINITEVSNIEEDPMYLGSKLFKAFSSKGMVSDKSPNRLIFSYQYRPDTGCGGIVINQLDLGVFDNNNNQIVSVTFRQGSFEGKCIDDVIYQMVEKLSN